MIVTNPLLDAALSYAARGWHVLALWWAEDGICACMDGAACASPGKHPIAYAGSRAICPAGLNSATVDPELLRQWWAWAPEANVGIVTGAVSGIVVLDSDPRHGGDESLHMLEDSLPDGLPDTVRALTGGGGEHVLFAHPGGSIRNKTGRDWGLPGLDVRGDGGYIVAAPSLHLSGRRYAWDSGSHPETTAIAELPAEVVRRLSDTAPAQNGSRPQLVAGGTDIEAILRGVPDGSRGTELFKAAAKMRRIDIPYAIAQDIITRAADAASPPYPRVAAVKALDSAYRRYEPSEIAETEVQEAGDEAPTARFRWYSLDELADTKPPTWLIDNVLVAGSFAMAAGRERSLKSFGVVDMGLSIATGSAWHGMKVQQGPVGYIVGEGRSGITRRADAWCIAHDTPRPNTFRILPQPVQMLEASDVDELTASFLEWNEPPILIIIDTLARCFVGGEENSAKDMGEFIAACDRLQRTTGATVLVVHHGTKADGAARGSSALLAAVDTHINVSRDMEANRVTFKCEKQKDADEFETIIFEPRIIALPGGESSLVLTPARITVESMNRVPKTMALVLRRFERPVTNAEWLRSCTGEGIPERSFYRGRKQLLDTKMVLTEGRGADERFRPTDSQKTTDTTDMGLTKNNVSRGLTFGADTDITDTPFKGVSMTVPPEGEKTSGPNDQRLCADCGEPTANFMQRYCPPCRMKGP